MALIICPECGRENVSDSAESCPNCGYGIRAHYERIKLEELEKERQKKLEEEKLACARREKEEKLRAAIEAKNLEEERISSIPKPNKPKISVVGTIIGGLICWFGISQLRIDEWDRQRSIDRGNGDPVFYGWLFLMIGISVIIFVIYIYSKQRERYNLAQADFEAYQRQIVKEQDDYERRQKMNAEAERIRQMNAPKCPMCKSTNIERITTTSRAISVAAVGLASSKIGKQYKCKNCKHMW